MKRSFILSALVAPVCYLSGGLAAQSESLSFQLVGKLICIEATVENQTGLFMLDTGYQGVLLNSRYFNGRESIHVVYDIRGVGTPVNVRYVNIPLTPAIAKKVYAETGDLSYLEKQKGISMLGLIGNSFLADYELTFDYVNHTIFLEEVDRKGQKLATSPLSDPPTIILKCAFKGHLPYVEAQIDGLTLRMGIDSGVESNILTPKIKKSIAPYLQNETTTKVYNIGFQTITTLAGKLTGLAIENIPYAPMQTVFSDLTHLNLELIGPKLDGILGYEFLSQYKTAINFKKKEIYIWTSEKKLARN